MLILNGFLLLVGCLMDIMSAIMILVPLLAPMAASYGIDPIHLGIVFIVNLELGYLTPPMGLNLFVSSSLFNKSIGEVIRSVLPTLGILAIQGFFYAMPRSFRLLRATAALSRTSDRIFGCLSSIT